MKPPYNQWVSVRQTLRIWSSTCRFHLQAVPPPLRCKAPSPAGRSLRIPSYIYIYIYTHSHLFVIVCGFLLSKKSRQISMAVRGNPRSTAATFAQRLVGSPRLSSGLGFENHEDLAPALRCHGCEHFMQQAFSGDDFKHALKPFRKICSFCLLQSFVLYTHFWSTSVLHPEDHTIDPHVFYQFFITHHHNLVGWWLSHPSEKYEFVSWGNEITNIWKVIIHSCSSHHQTVIHTKINMATEHLQLSSMFFFLK